MSNDPDFDAYMGNHDPSLPNGPIEDDECKHGMVPAWCSACKEAAKPKPRWEATGFTMQARFGGPCRAERCHEMIEEGDTIVQQRDENQLSDLAETRFVCSAHK